MRALARNAMRRFHVFVGLATSLALGGGEGGRLMAQVSYREVQVVGGGAIRGTVRLGGDIPAMARLSVTKDEKYCGTTKKSSRLVVGKSGGVMNAIVWLEGVKEGKKRARNPQFVLDQSGCEYVPHVLLLPSGAVLDIVNNDPILHNVHTYDGERGRKTLFNIAQPVKGQRTTVKQATFSRPGVYLTTCDAGHPWMSAYIIVTGHPYFAITNAGGEFTLDDIPPGSYTLKMWHEGVTVVKEELEHGTPKAYVYEAPYEQEKKVTVTANGREDVNFVFEVRPLPLATFSK